MNPLSRTSGSKASSRDSHTNGLAPLNRSAHDVRFFQSRRVFPPFEYPFILSPASSFVYLNSVVAAIVYDGKLGPTEFPLSVGVLPSMTPRVSFGSFSFCSPDDVWRCLFVRRVVRSPPDTGPIPRERHPRRQRQRRETLLRLMEISAGESAVLGPACLNVGSPLLYAFWVAYGVGYLLLSSTRLF